MTEKIIAHLGLPTTTPSPARGRLFSNGPPAAGEPEAFADWSDAHYHQRLPDSDPVV